MKKLRVVMLMSVVAMVASLVVSVPPELTKAASSSQIEKGETKNYWVAPASSLTIYYYPNGTGPSVLEARISAWAYWLEEQPPQVTVDIYSSSRLPGSKWYWMYQMDVKPWWRTSPRLYLVRRVYKYKFEIRCSRLARVTLRLR